MVYPLHSFLVVVHQIDVIGIAAFVSIATYHNCIVYRYTLHPIWFQILGINVSERFVQFHVAMGSSTVLAPGLGASGGEATPDRLS